MAAITWVHPRTNAEYRTSSSGATWYRRVPDPFGGHWVRVHKDPRLLASEPVTVRVRSAEPVLKGLVNSFTVGCDPEFVALAEQGPVNLASAGILASGPLGWDHNGDVGEVRPTQNREVDKVVHEIRRVMKTHVEMLKGIPGFQRLRAGAYVPWPRGLRRSFVTLGGHVHLDVNPYPGNADPEFHGGHLRPDPKFISALDHVTLRLEHLDILPKSESKARRESGTYGKLGDIRIKAGRRIDWDHPKKYRFEYRAMASWLYSPRAAQICMTAAKLAVVDPDLAMSKLGATHSFQAFQNWLEAFKGKDRDVDRILDTMMGDGVKGLQADPEADVLKAWEVA